MRCARWRNRGNPAKTVKPVQSARTAKPDKFEKAGKSEKFEKRGNPGTYGKLATRGTRAYTHPWAYTPYPFALSSG